MMYVGVCRFELDLHDNFSLKGKRSVVKRLIHRTRNKFNLAIAEIEENDNLTCAVLGFSVVGNEKPFINSVINKIINFVELEAEGSLSHYQFEIERY